MKMRFKPQHLFIFFALQFLSLESKNLILITSLYNETVTERKEEYLECLERNLNQKEIKKIHIFYDHSKDHLGETSLLESLKKLPVEITSITKRPRFNELFEFVNTYYPNQRICISNADIYFDETLKFIDFFNLKKTVIALTRWDEQEKRELKPKIYMYKGKPAICSQDVWIFESPIENFDSLDLELGTAYCDGSLAYLAYHAGYKLINPALSVITHHLHLSQIRHWKLKPPLSPIIGIPWCNHKKPRYIEKP
jgi:hypothetical protein